MKRIRLMSAVFIATVASLLLSTLAVQAEEASTESPSPLIETARTTSEAWRAKLEQEQSKVVASHESQESGQAGNPFMKMFEGLGYCLAVFLIGVHLYKRFHKHIEKGSQRSLRLIESLQLPTKAQLFLVEVDGQRVLVSSGSQTMGFFKVSQGSIDDYEDFKIPSLNDLSEHQSSEESQERVC